eukprot:1145863-Rhodomonas_salina.1
MTHQPRTLTLDKQVPGYPGYSGQRFVLAAYANCDARNSYKIVICFLAPNANVAASSWQGRARNRCLECTM